MKPNYELKALAKHYERKGDYEVAEHLFAQSIKLKIQVYGPNYSGYGADLYRLGLLKIATSNDRQEKNIFVRALKAGKDSLEKPFKLSEIFTAIGSLTINFADKSGQPSST